MTTYEIKRALAEREGWEFRNYRQNEEGDAVFVLYKDGKFIGDRNWMGAIRAGVPDYLNSKDAIGCVLKTLTEEEWNRFISLPCLGKESFRGTWAQFYLTLPTEVLARCVAEAIKK